MLVKCPECNAEVSDNALSCPNCGYQVKNYYDKIKLNEIREHKLQLKIEKRKNGNKLWKILIPVLMAVIIVIGGFVVNHIVMSNRYVFSNQAEMEDYLNGSWIYPTESYKYELINVWSDTAEKIVSYNLDYARADIMQCKPQRGYFIVNKEKYVIQKDGTIISQKNIYKKLNKGFQGECFGTSVSLNNIHTYYYDENNLTFKADVINNGKAAYNNIMLKAKIEDNNEVVIPALYADDIQSSELKSGETRPIEINLVNYCDGKKIDFKNVKDVTYKLSSYNLRTMDKNYKDVVMENLKSDAK